jgi:hypothetical protein
MPTRETWLEDSIIHTIWTRPLTSRDILFFPIEKAALDYLRNGA